MGKALVIASGLWGRIGDARIPLTPTSRSAARALLPMDRVPPDFTDNVVGLWLGPRAHLVHYPVSGASLLNVVAVLEGESELETWNAPVGKAGIVEGFRHWAKGPRQLIECVPQWRQWRLYAPAADPPPLPGNVIRVGDAAGPVQPFLAQGGVLALEDAAAVASALADSPDAGAALEGIRAARLARRAAVAMASRANGRVYHLDGLAAKARDLVLRASSPERLLARFDWLYGFVA
jgi:salicylate hydroxylase